LGYEVQVDEGAGTARLDRQVRATDMTVDLTPYYHERLRFGVISCTHFGNFYRQLGPLKAFYDICVREQVGVVIHAGDLVDGAGMYRGQEFDQYAHGADEQEQAALEEYPRSDIPTKVIGGNHDYSFITRAGYNIVRKVCESVPGLEYCGLLAATFTIGDQVKVLSLHRRGGVPYARSYRSQKANEALGRGEQVPEIFVIGGLHVVDYVPYLGVQTFLAGAFQGQTPYLKEKALWPDIGGWIVTVNLADDGKINRCLLEWISFQEVHEFGE
jgi:predicted phosphodiesterase